MRLNEASVGLRDDGVIIVAAGVGENIDLTQLNVIANDPSREFFFPDSTTLTGPLQTAFQQGVCQGKSNHESNY